MDLPHKEINPQSEDGHVDIANEIVEALAKTYLCFIIQSVSPTYPKILYLNIFVYSYFYTF